ncbi:MAG: molybdenum hydroxylase [Lachnospiraceae bacterium]|nr:molybdenum hydroxylase [Lachnospiraceae bacterium]
MITDQLVIVRGGGDLATGVIWALRRAGFPVLILESEHPSAIRRTAALSEAVYEGTATVEDITVRLARNLDQAQYFLFEDGIAMLADPRGDAIRAIIDTEEKYSEWDTGLTTLEGGGRHLFLTAVVDAILAKRNLGTTKDMAPFVIALGPGFTAGVDCDVVIETMRGHTLARPITEGSALPNTGTPGLIAGHSADRVIHSPAAGVLRAVSGIGDEVEKDQVIARIETDSQGSVPVKASFTGLLRGLIRDGYPVSEGFKIADIDPRREQYENCFTISDKARALGGAVVMELVGYAARKAVDE